MNTLTKLALGLMGQLKPQPPAGDAPVTLGLPQPRRSGGMPLMQALRQRESQREFEPKALRKQTLSDLLWAAAGINRPGLGGRTAPSAMNAQEVQLYVALPQGLFRYEPTGHRLQASAASRRASSDRVSGLRRQRAAGPCLRRRPRADETGPCGTTRGVRLRRRRRDGAERVPVLQFGGARHGDSRLVRPPRPRAGDGPRHRPATPSGADRGLAQRACCCVSRRCRTSPDPGRGRGALGHPVRRLRSP